MLRGRVLLVCFNSFFLFLVFGFIVAVVFEAGREKTLFLVRWGPLRSTVFCNIVTISRTVPSTERGWDGTDKMRLFYFAGAGRFCFCFFCLRPKAVLALEMRCYFVDD